MPSGFDAMPILFGAVFRPAEEAVFSAGCSTFRGKGVSKSRKAAAEGVGLPFFAFALRLKRYSND